MKIKIINFESKLIKLSIIDTAGQERYRNIASFYNKGAQGIILIYDVTDESSFETMQDWISQIELITESNNVCKVLVGNNCDKPDRKVTKEEGKRMAEYFNIKFFEASPTTNKNVNEVFYYLVGEILKMQEGNNIQKNINIKEKNNSENNKKCH